MPDGDVYDHNVEKWWQTAARRVFGSDDEEQTLPPLLRALAKTLKGGCPEIDRVASITAEAVCSPHPLERREAAARLEQIRRRAGSIRTDIAVDTARRIMADLDPVFPTLADRQDQDGAELVIAERILVELATTKIAPASLLPELVNKEQLPFRTIVARRDAARDRLARSPQLTKLTREILEHPEGQLVKTPRLKTPKPSQKEITFTMALGS